MVAAVCNSARLSWHRWLVGAVHRTQHMVSFYSGRLPTGSVQGTHRVRLRKGTHKSMALLLRVPCKAPINGCRATARSAIGAIARRRPLVAIVCPRCVAFNVSALWHVRRCGDAARQTPWRCAVSALPRSRAPALSVCVACAACWPFGGGRSLRCRVLGALGQSGCCGRAGPCGRAGACWECWACVYGHRLWACVLGVHVAACGLGGLCWASVLGMRAGPFALGPLVMGLRDGPRARPLFRALVLGLRSGPFVLGLGSGL